VLVKPVQINLGDKHILFQLPRRRDLRMNLPELPFFLALSI
jgi:hypothetical protein